MRDFARRGSSRGTAHRPGEQACVKALPGNGKKAVFPPFHMGILTDIGQGVQRRAAMVSKTITGARYGGGRIIATARDSWSPTAPPRSGLQAPGGAQVQAQVQVQVSGQSSARAQALP